jgi:hypothetical protein
MIQLNNVPGRWLACWVGLLAWCGEAAATLVSGRSGADLRCVVLPNASRSVRPYAAAPVAAKTCTLLLVRANFAGESGNPTGTVFGSSGLGLDEVRMLMMQVDDFFYANSGGLVRFAPTYTDVLALPKTQTDYGQDYLTLMDDARAAAKSAGYDATKYDGLIVLTSRSIFPYDGLNGGDWIHINGAFTAQTIAHELGHFFGMGHSAAWSPDSDDPIGEGQSLEYGNPFDPMGTGRNLALHFSPIWKWVAGWWGDDAIARVTTSGTTRVHRHDHFRASGVRALVVTAAQGVEYWVSVARTAYADNFQIYASPTEGVLIQRNDPRDLGYFLPELIRASPPEETYSNDFLGAQFVPGMSLIDAANKVKITVVAVGGATPDEWADVKVEFNHTPALAFSREPLDTTLAAGATLTLTATSEVAASYRWWFNGQPISGQTSSTLTIANAQPAQSGTYAVEAAAGGATIKSREAKVTIAAEPVFTFDAPDRAVPEFDTGTEMFGGFRGVMKNPGEGEWYRDGVDTYEFSRFSNGDYMGTSTADGLANQNLAFFDMVTWADWITPAQSSFYYLVEKNAGGTATSIPLTIGLRSAKKIVGDAEEVGSDIHHPNGNVYDQLLLTGKAATFSADAGQVTRCSYLDLNDDIVQVEFSGRGNLTINLDAFSPAALPVKYNQAIKYVKGHATIIIVGADETTNVSVFTVGPKTAIDQALFPEGMQYDGVADIKAIGLQSVDGRFGGIRAADTEFWGTKGWVGINATRVKIVGPVRLMNLSARDAAEPMLRMDDGATVEIAGGDLQQENEKPVHLDGQIQVTPISGATSAGTALPAQSLRATFRNDRR